MSQFLTVIIKPNKCDHYQKFLSFIGLSVHLIRILRFFTDLQDRLAEAREMPINSLRKANKNNNICNKPMSIYGAGPDQRLLRTLTHHHDFSRLQQD